MRTESEVERFATSVADRLGDDDQRVDYYTACYESCVPRTFWGLKSSDITYNTGAFKSVVLRYVSRRRRALRHGYSLLFLGDNGVGKTMFMCYVLTQALRRGNSVYYTTLARLDRDIKRGFRDERAEARLVDMLSSDFVAVDEIGKEHFRADSYLNTQLESLMKQRYDDGEPMLMGTNLDFDTLCKMYGSSMASMWDGKYQAVMLEPGDSRKASANRMRRAMEFDQ